jgi:hypothetical protein
MYNYKKSFADGDKFKTEKKGNSRTVKLQIEEKR